MSNNFLDFPISNHNLISIKKGGVLNPTIDVVFIVVPY